MSRLDLITGAIIFAVLFWLERKARSGRFLPLFFFLSTIFHELAHFTVALLLGGRPSLPNLIPRRRGDMWILGEVRFYISPINAFPSATAPLLLFPLSILAYVYLPPVIREITAWVFLKGAIPSGHDFRVAFTYFVPAIMWILFLVIGFQLLGKELLPIIYPYAEKFFSLIDF